MRSGPTQSRVPIAAAALIVALTSCGGGDGSTGPASVGTLRITTQTSGSPSDPDGYTISVDGTAAQPVGSTGALTFAGLAPGSHSAQLLGIASNCTLAGLNPRTVTVQAGSTTDVAFAITCVLPGVFVVDSVRPVQGLATALWPAYAVYFNRPVNPASLGSGSITLADIGGTLPIAVTAGPNASSLRLDAPFLPAGNYTLRLTAAVADDSGRQLTPHLSTITTRPATGVEVIPLTQASIQKLTADATGRLHLLTLDPSTHQLWYSGCATDCGGSASWQTTQIDDSASWTMLSVAIDGGNGVHVLYSATTSTIVRYATCAAVCGTLANWSHVTLDAGSKSALFGALTLDNTGKLHAVTSDWTDGKLHYRSCATACTVPANWATSPMAPTLRNLQDVAIAAGPTGRVHVAYRGQDVGTSLYPIEYAECVGACGVSGNWSFLTLGTPTLSGSGSDLQVDGLGTVHHVYYRGASSLEYATCVSSCTQMSQWTTTTIDPAGGGIRVALARGPLQRTAIAYSGPAGGLTLAVCLTSCGNAGNWRYRQVDARTNSGHFPGAVLDAQGQPQLSNGMDGPHFFR